MEDKVHSVSRSKFSFKFASNFYRCSYYKHKLVCLMSKYWKGVG